jgi:hypothetical protein
MAVYYCPVCRKYSDKFRTQQAMEDHLTSLHPMSPEAAALIQNRTGFGQTADVGKVTPQ